MLNSRGRTLNTGGKIGTGWGLERVMSGGWERTVGSGIPGRGPRRGTSGTCSES